MSSLAWIDFDEAERQRAQRIMALFQERETRDELGLGAIRDSIADHLFPGTSTIQTRLRYMLFIPWILQELEGSNLTEAELRVEARNMEIDLAVALQEGGESTGVIGRDAGPRLQRLPSSVYWAGLGTWGIREFSGSIESLFSELSSRGRRRNLVQGDDAVAAARSQAIWHPALPPMPENLLESAVFQLTRDEADFLIERLFSSNRTKSTLFTTLARKGIDADCDYIWEHPHLSDFPTNASRLVQHGEIFSQVMHGAALLYNLDLSRLRENDEWIEEYQGWLQEWRNELDIAKVRAWSLDEFWGCVDHHDHAIRPFAKRFVSEWRDLVLQASGDVTDLNAARDLVRTREEDLKKGQSRYKNPAVRDRWTGRSGAYRIDFRWPGAKSHLRDLANAE
jgi:hypothetical protein